VQTGRFFYFQNCRHCEADFSSGAAISFAFYVNQVSVHIGSGSPAILPADKKIGIHPIRFI